MTLAILPPLLTGSAMNWCVAWKLALYEVVTAKEGQR